MVLGVADGTESPEDAWSAIESEIFQSTPGWEKRLMADVELRDTFVEINKEIVIRLERLIRAVARLYTIGGLGPVARRWSNPVYAFLPIRDEELGNRTYAKTDA